MAQLNLSAPWHSYYKELEAFFQEDNMVRVIFDEVNMEVKLYVKSEAKANALAQLIIPEQTWGDYTLKITVVPPNANIGGRIGTFREALDGNGAVSYIESVTGIFTNPLHYIVFKNKVVQYYTDNLGDIHGMKSTLYQDIAAEIFEDADLHNVYYNTDVEVGKLGKPLGEWP